MSSEKLAVLKLINKQTKYIETLQTYNQYAEQSDQTISFCFSSEFYKLAPIQTEFSCMKRDQCEMAASLFEQTFGNHYREPIPLFAQHIEIVNNSPVLPLFYFNMHLTAF